MTKTQRWHQRAAAVLWVARWGATAGASALTQDCIRLALAAVMMHSGACGAAAGRLHARNNQAAVWVHAPGLVGRQADRQWCDCDVFTAINFYLNQTTDWQRGTARRCASPGENTRIRGEARACMRSIHSGVEIYDRVCLYIVVCV